MAVKTYSKSNGKLNFRDLTGGLDTRHSPLVIESDSKKKLKASSLNNVDFFKDGAVQKRFGKTQQGDTFTATAAVEQAGAGVTTSFASPYEEIAYKFTPGSTFTLKTVNAILSSDPLGPLVAKIYSHDAGPDEPDAEIVSSADATPAAGATPASISLTFTPTALTSGTTYWLAFRVVPGNRLYYSGANTGTTKLWNGVAWSATTTAPYFQILSVEASLGITGIFDYRHGYAQTREQLVTVNGNLYKRNKSGSAFINTWTSLANTLEVGQDKITSFAAFKDYAFVTDGTDAPAVVWDGVSTGAMRHGYRLSPPYTGYSNAANAGATIGSISGTNITLAANQGASGLYVGKTVWLTGSANINPQPVTVKSFITTGTKGSATYYVTSISIEEQEIQLDHTAVKWNGATVAVNTSSGTRNINTTGELTCFSVLLVTSLKSGGYRSSEFSIDVATGTAANIQFSNIAAAATTNGTEFAFDISDLATTVFMSQPFNPGNSTTTTTGVAPSISYHKVSASTSFISGGINPIPTAATAFDLLDEVPTTNDSLLDEYGLPTNYFTAQIDAPKSVYMALFQGFLCVAGDPSTPNRLYTSQADAPQVWSGAGESYGSFFDLDTADGDVIKGVASHNTSLYVFKQRGIYYGEFTGIAAAPFTFRRLQTSLGALSGWSVKQLDWGVVFLSERGPAYVSGTQVGLLPGAEDIQNLFDPNDSAAFNLDVMKFSTAGHNPTKQQVWWGVASANATNRDQVLVYDYGNRAFWLNTDSANYFTEVGDSAGFFGIWSGNYNGEVFQQESGATDDGVNIPFTYQSAWVTFSGGSDYKSLDRIWVRGDVQSSASTLTVEIFKDFSATASRTVTFDMTDARFKAGIQVPLNLQAKAFAVRFSNTSAVPLKIDSFQLDYQSRGDRV